jgi:hypothetical protein
VTGKPFKSAVLTLLELEISEPNSPMQQNTDQRKPKGFKERLPLLQANTGLGL